MDIVHPAAEVDYGQAVAKIPAVSTKAHQPVGLHLVEYPQLGDPAAAAGDFEGPVWAGQYRGSARAHPGFDDVDLILKPFINA
jgi:hypothetical protein